MGLSYAWAAFLGLLQGLTEFLPVSSSGHLALAQHLGHGAKENMAYDVLLHLATVLAVVGAFYKDILQILTKAEKRPAILWIIVGSIPAGVIGILFKDYFESAGEYPFLICGCLLLTAALLFVADYKEAGDVDLAGTGVKRSLLTGCFQVLGMLPGVSRSGSTITGGLLCGLSREEAVKFSFLLMVPAVCGANLIKAIKDPQEFASLPVGPAAVGFVIAAVSGFAAAKWMLRLVRGKNMRWFAIYCLLAGLAGFVYFGFFHHPAAKAGTAGESAGKTAVTARPEPGE